MQKNTIVGVDLAKKTIAICVMNRQGRILYRKSLSRQKFSEFLATTDASLIAMEACGGSHYWGRVCHGLGLKVMIIHPSRVKRFAPSRKKNDSVDAEAVCLAALNKETMSIRVKSTDQQDIEMLLNYRSQLVKQQVALLNQVQGLALEYGVSLPKGKSPKKLEKIYFEIENAENKLTLIARKTLQNLMFQAKQRQQEVQALDKELQSLTKDSSSFKLLQSIPGVGSVIATAILAHTGGEVSQYKSGRQFAASLGLVPRQYSTGGKSKLLGITKTGDASIRGLLFNGARSLMVYSKNKEGRYYRWIEAKREAKGWRVAGVALANKMARIIYAVLRNKQQFSYI